VYHQHVISKVEWRAEMYSLLHVQYYTLQYPQWLWNR